jgi:hypothetical protein
MATPMYSVSNRETGERPCRPSMFSSSKKARNFLRFLLHQILQYMHRVLNIKKQKLKLTTQFAYKSRDESFKTS